MSAEAITLPSNTNQRLRRTLKRPLLRPGPSSLRSMIDDAKVELIPMKSLERAVTELVPNSHISMTCSPAKTIEATLDETAALVTAGHIVTPHISARMVRTPEHLAAIRQRLVEMLREGFDARRMTEVEAKGRLSGFLDGATITLEGPVSKPPWAIGRLTGPMILLAVLGIALSAWFYTHRGSGPIDSIAVLPFEDLSAAKDQDYLSDGMTDQLISRLGTVGVFNKVISRRSVMRYKDNPKPMGEIARELDVRALVEGTIVFSGDRARVTATLIDAERDKQLWSDSFDEQVADILDLQNKVVRAIVAAEKTPSVIAARLSGAVEV